MEQKKLPVILRLALKDLKHEWILTTCLILAIAAVLSPLLLLFGLKYGIIDWGTEHLKENPHYREVRPMVSKSFTNKWFEELGAREDVAFVMPMTRQIASGVKAGLKGEEQQESFNIIPTKEGDPLLLENGAQIPGSGECVITHYGAEKLKAEVGDILVAKAGRIIKGKYEFGTLELKIKNILMPRASDLESIYVPLPILEAVERYKDGQAVPEFGWPGSLPKAYPLYQGIIIVLEKELTKFQELSLCTNTGLTQIELLEKDQLREKAGFHIRPGLVVYRLYSLNKPAGMDSIRSIRNKLRGKNALLFPWNSAFSLTLLSSDQEEITEIKGVGLNTNDGVWAVTGVDVSTPWNGNNENTKEMMQIMLPPEIPVKGGQFLLRLRCDERELTFPVSVAGEKSPIHGMAYIPERLSGILRLFQERNIEYDSDTEEFLLFRKGYAGFRLYAQSIYDVNAIRMRFDTSGIRVSTEILAIDQLIQLDKGMSVIFRLLAAVGIIGSAASLVASLYASVERKKKELSVLRLIGLSSFTLFRFPVYQGMFFGAGGFGLSMFFFFIFSGVINEKFGPYADKLLGYPMEKEGVDFCWIPPNYIVYALLFTVCIAALAAIIAAFRVTSIEPAEALRDE